MRKSTLKSFTAVSAVLALWAISAMGSSSAQPRPAAAPALTPAPASETTVASPDGFFTVPPRTFVPGPPSARRVRSGFRTDPRPIVQAPIKAIQCGQLLDVAQRRVRRNVTILINGDRITEIRPGRVRPENANAVIDLHDQVCAPGLMDMRVQYTSAETQVGEIARPQNDFDYSVNETVNGLDNARATLLSGVTTTRSPEEHLPGQSIAFFREAIDKWEVPGPRMFLASSAIGRAPALAAPPLQSLPGDELARTGADVRTAVRTALTLGEDWVTVNLDGAAQQAAFTADELAAMVDEAHKSSARITGRVETDSAARQAVAAGFDSIDHADVISRETADLMKARRIYWATTLSDLTPAFDPTDPRLGGHEPPDQGRDYVERMRQRDDAFRYAYSIGVPIVFASGADFEPGANRGRRVLEFSMYLALGVTPWDLLTFATVNPAAMLGESNNLGSLDAGKYADIVAYPRNPLEDVTVYNHASFVMKGGNVVRDDLERNPLRDVWAMQLPDAFYTVTNPNAPFTVENLTCTGKDC